MLSAPQDFPFADPKMCFAARLSPYGGVERGRFLVVGTQLPVWFGHFDKEEFEAVPAATGTGHSDGPVVSVLSGENEIARR